MCLLMLLQVFMAYEAPFQGRRGLFCGTRFKRLYVKLVLIGVGEILGSYVEIFSEQS